MSKVKIAFIGGGSYQWGPPIIRDLLVTKGLDGSELVLMDIDKKAAEDIKKTSLVTQKRAKTNWKISSTTNRKEALKGADFVVISISTGGFDSMEHDLNIPWSYGIHQTVGDTAGPGGLNRALRNIPVFEDIAKDINRYCPDAWVLNITNPMTTLTQTLCKTVTSGKVVGLCHEVYGAETFVADILDFDHKDPTFDVRTAGINHCIWLLGATYNGENIIPMLKRALANKTWAKKRIIDADKKKGADNEWKQGFDNTWKHNKIKRELMNMTGYLPMVGDRHIAEFFGHFTNDCDSLVKKWHTAITTIKDRSEDWLPPMKQKVYDYVSGKEKIDLKLSHEPVAPIIDAISNNETYYLKAGNLPNKGQISNLPQGVVVETPCMVNASGIEAISMGDLPDSIAAALTGHVYRQEMIVKAGMEGNKELALAALISDPMVQNADSAKKMLKEMMEATAKWLPQFYTKENVKKLKNKIKCFDCDTIHNEAKLNSSEGQSIVPKEITNR